MATYLTADQIKTAIYNLVGAYLGPFDADDILLANTLLGPGGGGTVRLTVGKPIYDQFAITSTTPFPVLSADAEIYIDAFRYLSDINIAADVANWATFRLLRYAAGVPAGVPVMAQRSTSTAPDGGAVTAFIPYEIPFFVGDTHLLSPGEVLALDITKNFAGQFVGTGVWEIDYHYT